MIQSLLIKLLKRILPASIHKSIVNYQILSKQFGQTRSMKTWSCIDNEGKPIPWYTYPSIEYIKQINFSQKKVFEFGSGNSTLFWAAKCKQIVSVEDDVLWYNKIKPNIPLNCDYLLIEEKENYTQSIHQYEGNFDVIIIDGSHRYECAIEALKKLSPSGFIILDNADWRQKTASLLRNADLIEVDMSGFGPINDYTWTTSFFLTRNVVLQPANELQPIHGIGGLANVEH